jgi:hypothetical protein
MRFLVVLLLCGCASSEIDPGPASGDPTPQPEPSPPGMTGTAPVPPSQAGIVPSALPRPDSRSLTVQWQGQQTGYWCGPGSTRMALSTRMANPPSQSTLASYLGTTTDGTDNIGLVAGALNHYLGVDFYSAKPMDDPPTAAQQAGLEHDILVRIGDQGYPLVANVISGWRPPGYPSGTIYHYVAIIGYDQSGARVLIADPAGDGAGGSSWTAVPRTYWISVVDLGIWIGGKGYAG